MEHNEKQNKLTQIIQSYVGMKPADKRCSTWHEMQSKMEEEINAVFTPPSTVESPFSNEELELINKSIHFGSKEEQYLRMLIYEKCNHLLTNANQKCNGNCGMNHCDTNGCTERKRILVETTNANEWPKEMYVWDSDKEETDPLTENVVYIDPLNRFVVSIDDVGYPSAWKHARPIEQKPKELKDLVKGVDYVWALSSCVMLNGKQKGKETLKPFKKYCVVDVRKNDIAINDEFDELHYFGGEDLGLHISITPPTEQQFTAAEEAAINEVKARFDKARKEVGNG